MEGSEEDEEGNNKVVVKSIPVFRYSTVFNISQFDNAPEERSSSVPLVDPVNRDEKVEQFVSSSKADIRYGGNRAFFSLGRDFIQIPPREACVHRNGDVEPHRGLLLAPYCMSCVIGQEGRAVSTVKIITGLEMSSMRKRS